MVDLQLKDAKKFVHINQTRKQNAAYKTLKAFFLRSQIYLLLKVCTFAATSLKKSVQRKEGRWATNGWGGI